MMAMTVFGDRAFKDVIKLKCGQQCGPYFSLLASL